MDRIDDAVNVAPDLHKVVFENDQVRVLEVTVAPGAIAAMHWHPENMNYIISGGKLEFTKEDGATIEVELEPSAVTSGEAGSHAVKNTGETVVRTVQVEMKR